MIFLTEDSLNITRRTIGSYSNSGIFTEGTSSVISIQCCVQPETQYIIDRQGLKKLQKTGNIIIYTSSVLIVGDNNQSGDIANWQGKNYEIMEMEHWKGISLEHYKYKGVLKNAN
jgi:hypothetical protein